MSTTVKTCSCEHKFQDDRYGKNKRVMNKLKNTQKSGPKWRCTVCGKEHE